MVGLAQEHPGCPMPCPTHTPHHTANLSFGWRRDYVIKWQNCYTPPLKTPCIRDQWAIVQLSSRVRLSVRWVWWQYASTACQGFVVNWSWQYAIRMTSKQKAVIHCTVATPLFPHSSIIHHLVIFCSVFYFILCPHLHGWGQSQQPSLLFVPK